MAKQLSYVDAVKILGAGRSKIIEALDRLTGGLLLAGAFSGFQFALSLFEAKGELANLSQDLVIGLSDRLRGLSRYDRSQRLTAAHSILVITAYFESLTDIKLPFDIKSVNFSKSEQVSLATGRPLTSERLKDLAEVILTTDVPILSPHSSYDETLRSLRVFYAELSRPLQSFLMGLALWDEMKEKDRVPSRASLTRMLEEVLPNLAVTNYEKFFFRLATSSPEVGYWTILQQNRATHTQVRRLNNDLTAAFHALDEITDSTDSRHERRDLAKAHQAAANRPIIPTGDAPEGLHIPPLSNFYVNPSFRVAAIDSSARPADESWWSGLPVYDDLLGFLRGHLTSLEALEAPLVILGQPGSGKSVLTKYLAAWLPPTEFLVVRVPLRDAPAEADIQTQVEDAVRSATGGRISWAELVGSAADALPVVLIDGFDELLQATGVSQSDYLGKVAAFQQRELDQGHPVAVLVTSRTAVANYARFPIGTFAAVLEPFNEGQVQQWLSVWNKENANYWSTHGLQPLSAARTQSHGELASQPLLLLMIALYDADPAGLQRDSAGMTTSDLYERLLTRFAEREIRKSQQGILDDKLKVEVERELLRLSIVGFAMFNRGRQWVSESELEADLVALLGGSAHVANAGLRAPLTLAQIVVGRFFFVHEAQATRDGAVLRTYEFLHATFGEYLIARLVVRELEGLAEFAEISASHVRSSQPDDTFLYHLLSFVPLSVRSPILTYLKERTEDLRMTRGVVLKEFLLKLFRASLEFRDADNRIYRPVKVPAPARFAGYSANLLLLTCIVASEAIQGEELFSDAGDSIEAWRNLALLWRSQLPADSWTSFVAAFRLERMWTGDRREVKVTLGGPDEVTNKIDPYWTFGVGPVEMNRGNMCWMRDNLVALRRESHFICDPSDDLLVHAVEPFVGDLGEILTTFAGLWPGRSMSVANAIIQLWKHSAQGASAEELTSAYETCLDIANSESLPWDEILRDRYLFLIIHQLANDVHRLPPEWLTSGPAKSLSSRDVGPWAKMIFDERWPHRPAD